jgi:hypothetical protein
VRDTLSADSRSYHCPNTRRRDAQKGGDFASFATSDAEPLNINGIEDAANLGGCISYRFRSAENSFQIKGDVANVANEPNSGSFLEW